MSKGSVFDFTGLYTALLKDIAVYLPEDQEEWNRDLKRLTLLNRTRDTSVFTMDLPALGKALDKALSVGRLDLDGMPLSKARHPGTIGPRLFWGLWSRLFDSSGRLKDNTDPNIVLFLRTLLYVGKNYKSDCAPKYLYEATKEFFDVEAGLPPPSPFWDGDGSNCFSCDFGHIRDLVATSADQPLLSIGQQLDDTRVLDSVQRVADIISTTLGPIGLEELSFNHGPGAVSDLRRGQYKYLFPSWGSRLESLFPYDMCGVTTLVYREVDLSQGLPILFTEEKADLLAVPKTMRGPRLIAKEPTCHQWIQHGVQDFLYSRISRSWLATSIDFSDQSLSQDHARAASISGMDCTMDLSSASDRISCSVVQRVFRRNPLLLGAFSACRTRFLSNAIDKKLDDLLRLRKFSTMGSALTFPVQSLVFLSVVLGVGRHLEPRKSYRILARQVRIFGDDLIFPKSWKSSVEKVLTWLHLKVNQTKTFDEGNFRESCGMDAWHGYDVTPPHVLSNIVESEPATLASWIAVANNFFKKGFWHVSNWLDSRVPRKLMNRLPVVREGSG